jgi:hypothetical protein
VRSSFRSVLAAGLIIILACAGVWAFGGRSAGTSAQARTAILELDTRHPGHEFERSAIGLSVDAIEVGHARLSAQDHNLIDLMRLLGPSTLRIGGGSANLSWWTETDEPAPAWATNTVTPADLATLRDLLRATGWQVLLGVNLGHFDPARAASEALAARRILGASLKGIEVGNEPNDYGAMNRHPPLRKPTYDIADYLGEANAYHNAIAGTTPRVSIDGPSFIGTPWLSQIGSAARLFTQITQHYYHIGSCISASASTMAPPPTDEELLSSTERQAETETLGLLAQTRAATGRSSLISETGTGPCNGNSAGSGSFASALWALDWTLRATSSGVSGLNFHGHLGVCGPDNQSPICASTRQAATRTDVTPQPEYYGLLAASRLEGGRFIPVKLAASGSLPNLTAWATIAPSGKITIAIDNLAMNGQSVSVSIPVGANRLAVEEPLTAPSVAATTGISLSGTHVTPGQAWRPRPSRLNVIARSVRVVVAPASAAIVTVSAQQTRRSRRGRQA